MSISVQFCIVWCVRIARTTVTNAEALHFCGYKLQVPSLLEEWHPPATADTEVMVCKIDIWFVLQVHTNGVWNWNCFGYKNIKRKKTDFGRI